LNIIEEDIIKVLVDTAILDCTSDSAESDPSADAADDFFDASTDLIPVGPVAVLQPAIFKEKKLQNSNALPKWSPRLQEQVNKAMVKELKSIISNNMFKLVVLPLGGNVIKIRLVYRTKQIPRLMF
jgi:hypothetical protein